MFDTTACSLFDSDGSVFYGVTFEDGEVRESVESHLVAPIGGWSTTPVATAVMAVRMSRIVATPTGIEGKEGRVASLAAAVC